MTNIMDKFKIPTLLGFSIIFLGIIAGVYLNLKDQVFLSKAAPNSAPQDITLTNITEDSVTISWQTSSASLAFATFGQENPSGQTSLDDRDNKPHFIHYVTLKNLIPKTTYQFKVASGKISSETGKFQTAQPLTNQTGFTPIIGSVLEGDTPLNEGIAYLSIPGAVTQSALIKTGGNFLIPLTFVRKADLSDVYPLSEETVGKITVVSEKGTANLLFKLKASSLPLPPIKLGQNIDLVTEGEPAKPEPTPDTDKYDLNGDGKANSADHAIVSSCINKKPDTDLPGNISCTKADINQDGKINQIDLDLMSQELQNQ